jgi:exonuclease III
VVSHLSLAATIHPSDEPLLNKLTTLPSSTLDSISGPELHKERPVGMGGDHRQQPRPVVLPSCPNNIKYSSSDLRNIGYNAKDAGILKIQRNVRKRLFSSGIWKPQSDTTGTNGDSASNQSAHIPTVCRTRKLRTSNARVKHSNHIKIKCDYLGAEIADKMSVCCLNAQSVVNKTDSISDFIISNDFDLVALTETWLKEDTPQSIIQDLVPDGYSIKHLPRPGARRGGGVAIIYKSTIDLKLHNNTTIYSSFEQLSVTIHTKFKDIPISVIYRPPPSSANGLTQMTFQDEWSAFIAHRCTSTGSPIIMGDLNVHLDDTSNANTIFLNDLLTTTGFIQHVRKPTHNKGHILDAVITRDNDTSISNLDVVHPGICDRHSILACDHLAIVFQLNVPKPTPTRRTVSFRRLKQIQADIFTEDFASCIIAGTTEDPLDAYNAILAKLVDIHAPTITKTIVLRNNTPYYTRELRDAKISKRKCERAWRHSKSGTDLAKYRSASAAANRLLRYTKAQYFSKIIADHSSDAKALFKVTNKLLGKDNISPLPSGYTKQQLAEVFAQFFTDKVAKIRDSFPKARPDIYDSDLTRWTGANLSSFKQASTDEVRRIINRSPSKSCVLDSIPTGLLKKCIENNTILEFISKMINHCVTDKFPDVLKKAIIIPHLKKSSLDAAVFNNYRPVSNLSFISKVVEKVVAARLRNHLSQNELLDVYQSAYRSNHSTETALIKVQSDIISSLDERKIAVLVLLDLSAAFDTIDHGVLIRRLQNYFGITGQALDWIKSYLTNRTISVSIGDATSRPSPLNIGVPQGSVLGPMLFTCYTTPLGNIISNHGLHRHFYADDTQLYITFDYPSGGDQAIGALEDCLVDIKTWMLHNFLKLNDDKTEVLTFSRKQETPDEPIRINIGDHTVKSIDRARNLGVIFDHNLTMEHQIANIRKQCFFQIKNIAQIRRYLDLPAVKTLVQANVISRLDYANGLLYGVPKKSLGKIQLAQNTAARLITRSSPREHITPILKDLHWLPVEYRVRFKVLTLTYKAIHGEAPKYISDYVTIRQTGRNLRSSNHLRLEVPNYNLKTYGKRSFPVASATEWNALPDHLKKAETFQIFKRHLKTYLFKEAYC